MGDQASAGLTFPIQRFEGWLHDKPVDNATLKAQQEAERARLGPVTSGVAETLGSYASPTSLFNFIPGAGGGLAGATHEGLTSALEGDDLRAVAANTLKGGVSGLGSTLAAHAITSPNVLSKFVDAAGTGGAASLAHTLFAAARRRRS